MEVLFSPNSDLHAPIGRLPDCIRCGVTPSGGEPLSLAEDVRVPMTDFMWEAHNWSKGDRLWLGVFTLLPVAVGVAIPIRALLQAEPLFGGTGFCVLCLAHPLMVFMLLMAYAPAAFNNHRISQGGRILWLLGFVVLGVVTLPVYWYLHVWRAPYGVGHGKSTKHA